MSWARRFPGDVATDDGRTDIWRDEFGHAHCPVCGRVTSRMRHHEECRCPRAAAEPVADVEITQTRPLLAALDRAVGAARAVSGR